MFEKECLRSISYKLLESENRNVREFQWNAGMNRKIVTHANVAEQRRIHLLSMFKKKEKRTKGKPAIATKIWIKILKCQAVKDYKKTF